MSLPATQRPTPPEPTASEFAASLPAVNSACTYDEYYAFVEPPFGLTPNTRFVFWGGSLSLALEQVMLAQRAREGVVLVTGNTGTGKTMLCWALAHHLRPHAFLSMVVNPRLGADDLLKQILIDFGVMSADDHRSGHTNYELFRTLEQFLVMRIPHGDRAVILIDEAQHLPPEVFEQIRLLSNLESENAKLLQIVLVGHPALESVLRQPELGELEQRISRRCELRPLTPAEVRRYVDHRLAVAQAPSTSTVDDPTPVAPLMLSDGTSGGPQVRPVEFTPDALTAIAALSKGVPRIVNLLCDRALETAYGREARSIDRALVASAAMTLKFGRPSGWKPGARTAAAIAASLMVLIAGMWWLRGAPRQDQPAVPAAARPAAAPIAGTLETARGVMVAAASFRTPQRAAEVVGSLEGLGLPAFARPDGSGGWHQVIVGPYLSVEEAKAAERQLAGLNVSDSQILPTDAASNATAVEGTDARSARVLMLNVTNRTSLVLELSEAPARTSRESVDERTVVLDIGPVATAVIAQELDAGPDAPCVAHASIQDVARPDAGRFIRLRVGLRGACRSRVRAAARRVYIDLAPPVASAAVSRVTTGVAPKPRSAAPRPQSAPRVAEGDVLGRARVLAQKPDVRGLVRLREEVLRQGERAGRQPDELKPLLDEVERYTNEARALRLQQDSQAFRGAAPRR